MTEGTRDIVPEYLRHFDAKLDRVADDVRDLKVRNTGVEEGVAGVNRRLDRMEMRLDHIEKPFDLTDAPH